MRGYCAIGVYHPKAAVNCGTLWRSAQGLDFLLWVTEPAYLRAEGGLA